MLGFKNTAIGYKTEFFRIENLELQKGNLYTLIGKNGIGKTTLFNTLCGFTPKLSGEIFLENETLETIKNTSFKTTFVPSKFDGIQHLKGKEFVALGRAPYTNFLGKLNPKDSEIIDETFALLNLEYLAEKDTAEMSDGERQLLAIAKALVQETPLILLDEPCAFLDYQNKLKVLECLKLIAVEKNKCIIQSSHDLELSLEFSDHFLVINSKEKRLNHFEKSDISKEKLILEAFS